MERLKLVAIMVTIVAIISLASVYSFFRPAKLPEKRPPAEIKRVERICDIFTEVAEKSACLDFEQNFCKEHPDVIECVAGFLTANISRESGWKMCQLKNETFLQQYCMANALVGVSLEDSLAECDLMGETAIKFYCRADQKKKILGIDAALPECDNLKEDFPADFHFCRAIVYSGIEKELARKECKLIEIEDKKTSCLNLLVP